MKKKHLFIAVVLLYLLPTFVQYSFDSNAKHMTGIYFGLPHVLTGDEPDYLLATYSIVEDFDVELCNNRIDAFNGSCSAGYIFRGVEWINYCGGENPLETNILTRQVGLSFFAALFVWPLAGSCLLENAVIYLTLIVSLISLFFLYKTLQFYGSKKTSAILIVFIGFALCSQLWHYSKTFQTEPYLAAFLIMAFYFIAVKRNPLFSGFFIALGFTMKYPFAVFLPIFLIYLFLNEKNKKQLFLFVIPSIAALLLLMLYNSLVFSNPFFVSKAGEVIFGNYLYGIFQYLFFPSIGFLVFAPFLLFGFIGFREFFKENKREAAFVALIFISYFLFWAFIEPTQAGGGGGYSGRYIIPVIPMLSIPLLFWLKNNKSRKLYYVFILLLVVSFLISLQAAFFYPALISNPPWYLIEQLLFNPEKIFNVIF